MTLKHIPDIDSFKDEIMKEKAVIMIHKTNCPFCEKAEPWLEELAKENQTANISVVNKDDIASVLEVFQVKMYPTFVSFSKGQVVDVFFGDTQEDKVKEFVKTNI